MEMQTPAVKNAALGLGLPVEQPDKIKNDAEFRGRLEEIRPDAILVVAYGRIIPKWMLELPKFGNINLHGSLLPKYRGAAPIQWAVANGEFVTGVTTMRLDEGLDTGDMLLAQVCPIGQEETAMDVYGCLAPEGAKLMVETLRRLECGDIVPQKQDHSLATIAPILTREDGWMDFSRNAQQIYDRWRGFQPWPGAHTLFRGKKLIAHRLYVTNGRHLPEGMMLIEGDELFVGCGKGSIVELREVQIEGKKRMPVSEFLRGYQVQNGERLGV
jgi:methionyl-tRNA formyltransferase